jgi:hypothetical protein
MKKHLIAALVWLGLASAAIAAPNTTIVTQDLWSSQCALGASITGGGAGLPMACMPTPSTAGTVYYWNGSAWAILAGNASGTNCLQENSSGVPSWAACGSGGGATPGGSSGQVQWNSTGSFAGITGATTNGTTLTLVAPVLGTPASVTLTNGTGLPISTGLTGAGTGVLTALGNAINGASGLVGFSGALGTPTSVTLTNGTGLPISTGINGLGSGVATLLSAASTGTGAPVGNVAPTISGPTLSGTILGTYTLGGTPSISAAAVNSGTLGLANGGTAVALTASAGGIVYSTSSTLALLTGTVTAGQCLLSGSSTTPSWGSCAGGASVTSIAGNTGAFTLGGGITNSTNSIQLALNNATTQQNPSNPTATTSATGVMMGLGKDQAGSGAHPCTITPVYSGRVKFEVIGSMFNNTASGISKITLYFGTGTAPSNGVAFTGTQIGNQMAGNSAGASGQLPFHAGGIVTGLTPGTAYWFDLSLLAGANTSTIQNLSCNAMEF